MAETYTNALETINPRKATANLHRLYVNFAKFYEEGGASGQAEPDLDSLAAVAAPPGQDDVEYAAMAGE